MAILRAKPLVKQPKHMANASLSWQATTELEAWTQVNFRARTNQYLSRSSMANELPSYTFVDLGINDAMGKNLSLFIHRGL